MKSVRESVSNAGFPPELLSASVEMRRNYFASKVIQHPHLNRAYEEVLESIRRAEKGTLVFVFGPTGVGKTTLRRKIAAQLSGEVLPQLLQDPGRFPVIELEVPSPDSGRFDWTDYYLRGLKAFQEVRVQYRLDHGAYAHVTGEDERDKMGGNRGTRRELRFALETALKHRRPIAVLHDEAQHFKAVAGAKQLKSQMETIKSLASLTDAVLVFFGTYELLELTNLSGQLGRRSLDIHFPRYPLGSSEFKNVLRTFQRHLPLKTEPDLASQHEALYYQTAGCVGVLKDWLTRALELTLQADADTLENEHLKQSALSQAKLLQMAREIQEGEEQIQATLETEAEIRRLLQMNASRKRGIPTKRVSDPIASQSKTPHPGSRRVGERNPVRDPVTVR